MVPRIEPAFPLAPVRPTVPDAGRTRELVALLEVRRNAAVGLAAGLVVAMVAYAFRVMELAGPAADTRGSPGLFVLLAVVLAVTVGLVVTAALTVRTALRVAQESDEPGGPTTER